jgi:hypothetical protein
MSDTPSKSTPAKASAARRSSSTPAKKATARKPAAKPAAEEKPLDPVTPGVQDTPSPDGGGADTVDAAVSNATADSAANPPDEPEKGSPAGPDEKAVVKASRPETGQSVEAFSQGDDPVPTAANETDRARNGEPTEIGTDRSGKLRERDAVPTAATGHVEHNGAPVSQREAGQTSTEVALGDDRDRPVADLLNAGVRAEVGTGTGTAAPKDTSADYPSTALNRRSARGKAFVPDDRKHQDQPRHGNAQTSTDATAANATIQSFAGDNFVALRDEKGNEVKPSDFLEVPEGGSGAVRVAKYRVVEEYTVQRTTTTSQRLLFPAGAEVPVQVAEQLIALHG